MRVAPTSSAFAGALVLSAFGLFVVIGEAVAQAPPPAVLVQNVEVRDITPSTNYIGRVEAINAVDIRARVEGVLLQQNFKDGQFVRTGDLLYVIDPAQYQATLDRMKATVAGAQANLTNAESALDRARQLRASQAGTEAALQTAQATRDSAAATLAQSEADVKTAELNLGYTRITSPIDGRIGRSSLSVGNLVNPTTAALARVVQIDPIRVVFSVSDQALLQVRQGAEDEPLEALYPRFVPSLQLGNGKPYPGQGRVEFIGNEVDPQTLTIPVWAQFGNPGAVLIPGQFATVIIRRAESPRKPVVPLGAVQQDRQGRFVLLVGADNKVEMRRIQAQTQVGQSLAVDEGLAGGEMIIVQGFQNARPGQAVQPHPAPPDPSASGAGAPAATR